MDRIWAPWRMEYIQSTKKADEGCFLCVKESDGESSLVVGRGQRAFVIMNKFPYTNGHVMVVPVRHTGRLEDLDGDEIGEMMALVQKMVVIFKETFHVDGLNIGINVGRAAGAGLEEHVHIHIVPRWFGDTNCMPVIGDTRVISEGLGASYEKLKRRFSESVL